MGGVDHSLLDFLVFLHHVELEVVAPQAVEPCVPQDKGHQRIEDQVLNHECDEQRPDPQVVQVIEFPVRLLHHVDGRNPEAGEPCEDDDVVPVVQCVQGFLLLVDFVLVDSHLVLLGDRRVLDLLHDLVLFQSVPVDLPQENASQDEGQGDGHSEGYHGRPNNNFVVSSRGCLLAGGGVDGSQDHSLEGPVEQQHAEPAEPSEAVLVGQIMDRIECPACHLVVLEVLVVHLVGVAVCQQVVEPEEEDAKPGRPEREALS